ncbi:pentraxin-4 [Carcharodon carcharias]|uniref:pentraxin-4 n=1 Tax=Carcharodon carcharias TaxID=13397 RepID=UPI001B7EF795|nr:pentraxin-4 [Carcharodon carcharias]
MAFSKKFHWIFITWVCCNLNVSRSQQAESVKQRKPFFERLRRLEEQFRRFQELSLTRLQIISENFNISSNVATRLQSLTEQHNNITATMYRFRTTAENDIGSLKSWMKKLQKKIKKMDLKMSTLEKILSERSKQMSKDKKEQNSIVSNLTTAIEGQRDEIRSLAAGRNKLQKEMESIRDEVKGQGVKITSFEEQLKSALQNDALSTKPRLMQSAAAPEPLEHRARPLKQAPIAKQLASKNEGSICNVNSVMHFPNSSTENYATFGKGFSTGLSEMTICSWLRTKSNYLGTILSYATEDNDNKLVLYGRNTSKQTTIHFVIGDPAFRELPVIPLLDGQWHHVCIIWSSFEGKYWYYIDRHLAAAGSKFQKGYEIPAGGTLIIGQEQDNMGGGFDYTESFVGNLAGFTIWNRALTPGEIPSITTGKSLPGGRVLTFSDVSSLNGAVQHHNCTCLEHC